MRFTVYQHLVTVYPALFDKIDIVKKDKSIHGIYQLKIAQVRQKIRLHHSQFNSFRQLWPQLRFEVRSRISGGYPVRLFREITVSRLPLGKRFRLPASVCIPHTAAYSGKDKNI